MKKRQFEMPIVTLKDYFRYLFPISIAIIFYFLAHMIRGFSFQTLLMGFVDFIITVLGIFSIWFFSKLFIEWIINKK